MKQRYAISLLSLSLALSSCQVSPSNLSYYERWQESQRQQQWLENHWEREKARVWKK